MEEIKKQEVERVETTVSQQKACAFCKGFVEADEHVCSHCGEDVDRRCPKCAEWVHISIKRCPHCEEWLNKFSKLAYEREQARAKGEPESIFVDEAAEVAAEKEHQGFGSTLIILEIVLFAWFGCTYLDWSTGGAVVAAIVAIVLVAFLGFLRGLFGLLCSLLWAYVSMFVALGVFSDSDFETIIRLSQDGQWDYWWVGLIVFFVSLGLHSKG